ncbi:hypothetical protein, partial [Xanthomonas maliensis]|uniref:hypothetical protein n=1 Tax=Xanthomonas maliensis TaxID=1321368 RepID=UPI001EE1F9B9
MAVALNEMWGVSWARRFVWRVLARLIERAGCLRNSAMLSPKEVLCRCAEQVEFAWSARRHKKTPAGPGFWMIGVPTGIRTPVA